MKITLASLALLFVSTISSIAQSDIRRIDFKNFTYDAMCVGEESAKVTVKDGEFSSEKQEDGYVDRFYFNVFDIAYGDLTGDGKDEAVILTVCNTGGTGNFSEGFVYTTKANKPSLIARIPGGDRAYGGLRSAKVVGGLLVIESNDVGEMGGACCPEFIVTTKYNVAGGKLVQAGKADRRDLYQTERVSFAKGTSGKIFQVRIPADGAKRLVVGAGANQNLFVSVSSKDASVRLLEDAAVTEGINNFTAKLPKNGDYTIEIQNQTSRDIKITVNVKIQ
jgi:hypothetical protein